MSCNSRERDFYPVISKSYSHLFSQYIVNQTGDENTEINRLVSLDTPLDSQK